MSAQPAPRHLRLVDENGSVVPSAKLDALNAEVEKLRIDLKMAQRDVKAKNRRISQLEADKARERLEHPHRELIVRVLHYWHRKCRNGDVRVNPLTPDRFDAVAALAEMEQLVAVPGKRRRQREWLYQFEHFKAAIDGAHFDHFVSKRKNGSDQHYDDAELIFRSASKMDEFIARCPYPVVPILPARSRPGAPPSAPFMTARPTGSAPSGVAPCRFFGAGSVSGA